MPVYGHACKRIGQIRWSQKQGSMWFPRALCEWIGPHVVKMEALLYYIQTVWGHWKTCSVEIWSHLMSMAHCDYCVCMTVFSPISVIELTTKGSCHLYSLWRLCLCTSMTIETWSKLLTKCICHLVLWLPGSYGCPMIGEAEVSSYNAMSACKCTFELLCVCVQFNAYDMVWTAGTAKWARQKGTLQGFPFGSWSLAMFWKLCHGLLLWCNMRIWYLWVLKLYNDDMKWDWNWFELRTCNQNSFWCDSIICIDAE